MKVEVGVKYLVSTDCYFLCPDGVERRAVFGTVKGVLNDKDALGIDTNRHSSNWFLAIGNMVVAGCQIHYAVRCDECSNTPLDRDIEHEGKIVNSKELNSRIYFADKKR